MDETTTIYEQPDSAAGRSLILTPEAQYFLKEGAGWAKFLGIMGFVLCGLMVLWGFSFGTIMSYVARLAPSPSTPVPAFAGGFVGVVCVLVALLYFFPSLYLVQFANRAKLAVTLKESEDITASISKLKSFFKFVGILTIIILALDLLGMLGFIAGMHSLSAMKGQ